MGGGHYRHVKYYFSDQPLLAEALLDMNLIQAF